MKLKARSRLKQNDHSFLAHQKISEISSSIQVFLKSNVFASQTSLANWLKTRATKLPQLVISAASYVFSWKLINNFYPDQVINWLFPGSYLALIGLLALGHWYFFSFLTLKPKFSFLISLTLSWLLWLKLHQFEIDIRTNLTAFVMMGVILILTKILKPIEKLS